MKAKKLFQPTADLSSHSSYMAALIIMQGKCWAYYSVLVNSEVIWTTAVGTAGTDGIYVYVNPDFFNSLENHHQRAFLLAHEIGHIVLQHQMRGMFYKDRGYHSMQDNHQVPFVHRQYNMAADYVINADLVAHGMEMIEAGLLDRAYGRNDLVDSVYLTLMKEQQDEEQDEEQDGPNGQPGEESDEAGESGNGSEGDDESEESSDGDESNESDDGDAGDEDSDDATDNESAASGDEEGDEEPQPSDHGGHDDHFDPEYDGDAEEQTQSAAEDKAEIERKVDEALDSMQDAMDRGERHQVPSEGVKAASYRHSGKGKASGTNWMSELADRVTRAGHGGKNCWSRIHRRRYAVSGCVSPTRKGTFNRLALIVDISSSVYRSRLDRTLIEIAALIDSLKPTSGCLVMFTNTDVDSYVEVSSGQELLDMHIPSGGGTIMQSAVKWMEKKGLTAELTMCFTDGDLWDMDDWNGLAAADVLVILDRDPDSCVAGCMRECGIDHIVAAEG